MRLGWALVFMYFVIEVQIWAWCSDVAKIKKANEYDRKSMNEETRERGERRRKWVKIAEKMLVLLIWTKRIVAILVAAWGVYLIGAIITGGLLVLGYPVW